MADYHREREIKLALAKDAYTRLRDIFMMERGRPQASISMVGVRIQMNRFYDDADALWSRDTKLRLRRELFVDEAFLSIAQYESLMHGTPSSVVLTAKCGCGQQRPGVGDQDEYSHAFPEDEREAVWSESEMSLAFEYVARLDLPAEIHLFIEELDLACWGEITNERYEFMVGPDLACLDRTTFPSGRVDHELEVETDADPETALYLWVSSLKNQGIEYELQRHGKARRMRDELGVPYASQ